MTKTETSLSQQDRELLEEARKKTRLILINLITFTVLIILLLFYLFTNVQLPLNDSITITLILIIISLLPIYAINRLYRFHKIITDSIVSDKKIILEAETRTDFPKNRTNGTQFFKEDNASYIFFRLDLKDFDVFISPLRSLPKSIRLVLEVAQPSGILLKYQTSTSNKNFKTEIGLLNKEDRKIIVAAVITVFKFTNFAVLPLIVIVFGFASDWKTTEVSSILVAMFIIFFVLGNIGILLWYWITVRKFRNSDKIIITGMITDKLDTGGKYPKSYIYFGLEKIDVSNNYSNQITKIGDTIAIHYFQKPNGEKGSLIRVEKV